MKRFLVFASCVYYPCGGWEDFVEDFATLEEAAEAAKAIATADWWHVVDTKHRKVVLESWNNK